MSLNRLMWLFAGLFMLFAAPLLFVEDRDWARIWVSLSTLFLGLFAFAMAADGVARGQIKFHFSTIRHADQPRIFWAAITIVFGAGVAVVVTAFWAMFIKTW